MPTFREQLTQDLDAVFFRTGVGEEFAELGRYRYKDGTEVDVGIIPDVLYSEVSPQPAPHALRVQSRSRSAMLPIHQLTRGAGVGKTPGKGDTLKIGENWYKIITFEPDESAGIATVTLHENGAPS